MQIHVETTKNVLKRDKTLASIFRWWPITCKLDLACKFQNNAGTYIDVFNFVRHICNCARVKIRVKVAYKTQLHLIEKQKNNKIIVAN